MFIKKLTIILICAILLSCNAVQKEKDYIIMSNDALEILVPKYIAVVSLQAIAPATNDLLFLKGKKWSIDEQEKIKALYLYLNRVVRYDKVELASVIYSYQQLLSTSRVASESAKK